MSPGDGVLEKVYRAIQGEKIEGCGREEGAVQYQRESGVEGRREGAVRCPRESACRRKEEERSGAVVVSERSSLRENVFHARR